MAGFRGVYTVFRVTAGFVLCFVGFGWFFFWGGVTSACPFT